MYLRISQVKEINLQSHVLRMVRLYHHRSRRYRRNHRRYLYRYHRPKKIPFFAFFAWVLSHAPSSNN